MQPKTLALNATDIQDFDATRTDVVIFCETGQHLLFVGGNDTWGLPGGKQTRAKHLLQPPHAYSRNKPRSKFLQINLP